MHNYARTTETKARNDFNQKVTAGILQRVLIGTAALCARELLACGALPIAVNERGWYIIILASSFFVTNFSFLLDAQLLLHAFFFLRFLLFFFFLLLT